MRRLFYVGLCLLLLFEAANVYFIMPLPFSQRVRSIDAAYFLYSWRWVFRVAFAAMILAGIAAAWRVPRWRKAFVPASLLLAGGVVYATNFKMSADRMFLQPALLTVQPLERNTVEPNRLGVGVD